VVLGLGFPSCDAPRLDGALDSSLHHFADEVSSSSGSISDNAVRISDLTSKE
jgi:hypothetical protein